MELQSINTSKLNHKHVFAYNKSFFVLNGDFKDSRKSSCDLMQPLLFEVIDSLLGKACFLFWGELTL